MLTDSCSTAADIDAAERVCSSALTATCSEAAASSDAFTVSRATMPSRLRTSAISACCICAIEATMLWRSPPRTGSCRLRSPLAMRPASATTSFGSPPSCDSRRRMMV
ncbi:hypothetical protein D3C72_2280600 [compost metagenome]